MSNINTINLVQISDSHLFSELDGLHFGHQVYQNLKAIFELIMTPGKLGLKHIDAIVFTGDLSQDHSVQSYRNFANAFAEQSVIYNSKIPLYWLPGNHDESQMMHTYLQHELILADKVLRLGNWQLLLLNSKTETPAGMIPENVLKAVDVKAEKAENNLLFMHHHPINVEYFIDKHGLKQQQQFWQYINNIKSIRGICCGHIHQGQTITPTSMHKVAVFTCPATSIQFASHKSELIAKDSGPGLRTLMLASDGSIDTKLHYIDHG